MYRYCIIFLLSVLSLVGCSNKTKIVEERPEAINAFVIDNDKLYVIGEYHDFEFTDNDIAKSMAAINSPLYKENILAIDIIIQITNQSEVYGFYNIYLDPNKTDKLDEQLLQENHIYKSGTLPLKMVEKVKIAYPNWDENQKVYSSRFHSKGQVIKLKNRDEILQKYELPVPLIADTKYFKTEKDIAGGVTTMVMLPVAVVAIIPMMAVWGIACAANSNGGC
ncbi:hypothetical protein PT276_05580 [Orbaceae bacterium ESL0721]|nr:hypothetical protein [Orbaceae bacterium ESL0721]